MHLSSRETPPSDKQAEILVVCVTGMEQKDISMQEKLRVELCSTLRYTSL